MKKSFIAMDLGGSSVRCMIGRFDGKHLSIYPSKRMANGPIQALSRHYWPILEILKGCKDGIKASYDREGEELASIGVDGWGVCFGLIDKLGGLLGNPQYERGSQRADILESIFKKTPRERIFEITGIRVQRLNTLYQLAEMAFRKDPTLAIAHQFLMVPDLINYWLTGRTAVEYTNASTTHLLDVNKRTWAPELLGLTGLPASAFPEVVEAGQVLDVLHDSVRAELGLPAIPVVATASHDTAAAVAAVSAVSQKTAYLISGTWGLLGVEINSPIINSVVSSYGFVNQGGVERTIRLLHNSLNMWLLQQCHDAWGLGQGDQAWEKTVALAEHAEAFQAFIDVDHPSLLLPPKMPDAVRALCLASGQRLPIHHGDVTRVILESLAMKSRFLLDQLSECVGWRPEVLHIVGGGGRNKMLNQLIANAIGLPVVVGPSEASAIGNIIVQMIAMREIKNLEEGRAIMQFSFPSETYLPIENERDTWIEQYNRYLRLINRQG